MEDGDITDRKKKSFVFNFGDEKIKLTDILSEDDDDFLVPSHFCEASFPVGIMDEKEENLPRRSLAWDSAFFNSAGVLDPDELSFMNRGFRITETHRLPGTHDVRNRISESESTPNARDFWFDVEPLIYNSMSCNVLNVFDKSPESGLGQKGMQDVQGLKNVDKSSRSKMKSYKTSIGRGINAQSERNTKNEPTSRRKNEKTPSPLPHKAIGSTTNISTKLNNRENLFGKSYLKMGKRSSISPTVSSGPPSIKKLIPPSASLPTSKIWRYPGRSKGIGNDINASTRSLPLLSSKRMSIESKDAKGASSLKGSLQSSLSSTNSSQTSEGTRLLTRPSGLRPPSSHTRFSLENCAPSYNVETRSRKLPQKVTTFGCSKQSDWSSAWKKLKTPCSDVPKNIKRAKIEENGTKKPSYSFDRLENLSRYFEAIDLSQEQRVNRPTKIEFSQS